MPKCYLLTIASGSSLDQHSNNVTLFNLVEQINLPEGSAMGPSGLVPVEIHAYFQLEAQELPSQFEIRFVLVADSGLETPTDWLAHKSSTQRFRTRTFGLPVPPVPGRYELRVDYRLAGREGVRRDAILWPILVVAQEKRPAITH